MGVHKSPEGWARLRLNVRSHRGVRAWRMDHRPRPRVVDKQAEAKAEIETFDALLTPARVDVNETFQPRLKGRQRVVFE